MLLYLSLNQCPNFKSQFSVRRPWNIEDALTSSPAIPELFESNIQDAISDSGTRMNFHQGRDRDSEKYQYGGAMAVHNIPTRMELEHVEVNGDKPSNAEVGFLIDTLCSDWSIYRQLYIHRN